jgi:hypothetical protein
MDVDGEILDEWCVRAVAKVDVIKGYVAMRRVDDPCVGFVRLLLSLVHALRAGDGGLDDVGSLHEGLHELLGVLEERLRVADRNPALGDEDAGTGQVPAAGLGDPGGALWACLGAPRDSAWVSPRARVPNTSRSPARKLPIPATAIPSIDEGRGGTTVCATVKTAILTRAIPAIDAW